MTMNNTWGFKTRDQNWKSTDDLIRNLVDIVSKGGNFLLNVGPDADGELPPPALERMEQIGQWMQVNGQAIYGTRPVPPYKVGRVCLTKKGGTLFAICLAEEGQTSPPEQIHIAPVKAAKSVRLLGSPEAVQWTITPEGLSVSIPQSVRRSPPCEHAWSLEIGGARVQ